MHVFIICFVIGSYRVKDVIKLKQYLFLFTKKRLKVNRGTYQSQVYRNENTIPRLLKMKNLSSLETDKNSGKITHALYST